MARDSDWYSEEGALIKAIRSSRWTAPPDPGIAGYSEWCELRRGGQGVVFSATQLSTRRRVAVKILHGGPFASPQGWARFEREIDLIAGFQHPHIVRLYDRGLTDQGLPYYVMELIEGVGLDDLLAPSGVRDARRADNGTPAAALPVRRTLELLAQICEAVNYAHQRGVIHRDLKPANILLDPDGAPHVLDFGLGKRVAEEPGENTRTSLSRTGDFAGSLPWASPEQLEGEPSRIDVRTDVYALGVLSFQMLTGCSPYPAGGGLRELVTHIREWNPKRPSLLRSGIDADVDIIVLKCLSKEPLRRYQSAGELARDLRHYLAGEPIEAKRDSAIYLLRKRVRRHRAVLGLAAALALALLAGLTASLRFWAQAAGQRDEARRQAAVARAVNAFLHDTLAAGDPYAARPLFEPARQAGVSGALDVASARVATAFAGQPEVEAAVRATLGATYLHRGEVDKAAPHIEQSLALRRTLLGERHPDTLTALELVAELREAQRQYAECERLILQVWEIRRATLGDDHADTLRALGALGWARHRLGREQEAEAAVRQALAGQVRLLGESHAETLDTMTGLAWVLQGMNRIDEAYAVARRASDGFQRLLGTGHPLAINSLDPLASLLMAQGRLDESERLYRDVLDGSRRVLGEAHPDTLTSLGNVARVTYERGRYAEAEALYREQLDRMHPILAADHPARCTVLYSLALTLKMQKKYAESERFYGEAMDAARRALGADNTLTIQILYGWGEVLRELGRFSEAEPRLRDASDGYRRTVGEQDDKTLIAMNSLAGTLGDLNRPAEAEPIYRSVLEVRRQRLGNEHTDTLTTLNDLALLLKNAGRLAEAEPLYREVVRTQREALGPLHRHTLIGAFNLAQLLCEKGDCDEAESLFLDVIRSAPDALTPDHWYCGWFRLGFGRCLMKSGRLAEAESHLLSAHSHLASVLGPDDRRTTNAARCLADLYVAWERPAEAAVWRALSEPRP
ncbi:Serine/threonine-protein kinase PknB [Phycisphaerae bacterium RAS1]|nr:Serine/threonine-protein kinase PknB [Phycisphaerae bacterium RAS1]